MEINIFNKNIQMSQKAIILSPSPQIGSKIQSYLSGEDIASIRVSDNEKAFYQLAVIDYDFLVYDLTHNDFDDLGKIRPTSLRTVSDMREHSLNTHAPIIVTLPAGYYIDNIREIIMAGADDLKSRDHLDEAEFMAHLRAIERSVEMARKAENTQTLGPFTLDNQNHKIFVKDRQLSLTPKEYKLLETLIKASSRTLSKETIARQIDGSEQSIDVHICHIRQKIEQLSPNDERCLITEYGHGYKLSDKPPAPVSQEFARVIAAQDETSALAEPDPEIEISDHDIGEPQ